MIKSVAFFQALVGSALAGTVIWDGRFNEMADSTYLNNWSWSNQIPPYQYYIHGSGPVTEYVNLSPNYKNPADTVSKQGVKMTIDSTSYWNGQNMRRTELIPQTTIAINKEQVFYHFSMMRSGINAPSTALEHQINFFESHFTEMKYGLISGEQGTTDANLRWDVGGQSQWTTTFDPMVWHNVAYGIDFSANTVTFYHSRGSSPLVKTMGPISVSTSSNGADWHLGVLRLPMSSSLASPDVEDWYFSGVYVESGSLTTSVGSGSSSPPPSTSSRPPGLTTSAVMTTLSTTTKAPATTSAPASSGPTIPKYGQCGGIGWTGATVCAAGSTCTVSNAYYSQCL